MQQKESVAIRLVEINNEMTFLLVLNKNVQYLLNKKQNRKSKFIPEAIQTIREPTQIKTSLAAQVV